VVLTGFSAGGSLAITTALALLNPSLSAKPLIQDEEEEEDDLPNSNSRSKSPYQNRILGLVPFYPVLDWYTPRTAKLSPGVVALPRWLTRMFDTSYLPPSLQVGRKNPLISPLHAPLEMLTGLPGIHMVVCGLDSLAQEGKDFVDMLGKPEFQPQLQGDAGGKRDVVLRQVEGAKHGWDKPPLKLPRDVEVEYQAAVDSIKRWEAALGK
jgi:acetyl esterase/lipase